MARAPTQHIQGIRLIEPVAQPTDSYVRPAEPEASPMRDIAHGLAALDTGMSGFLEKRRVKQNEADKIRAEALFNENNAMGWSEAVKQGKVPANSSPIFMRAYKAAQGNLAGIQLREKFNGAYLNWDGRNSNDPAAFQSFLGDFIKSNVGTDDPDILKTLNEHVRTMWSDGYDMFSKESANSVQQGNLNTRAAISSRSVDAASDEGLGSGRGTDYGRLWDELMGQREEALHTGTRHEDYDRILADTIAAKAVELQDPQLLDLLDKALPGEDGKMSDLPEFRDLKQTTIEKLSSMAHQRMVDEDRIQTKKDKAREAAIQDGVARLLADDPNADVPEAVLQEWARYDGEARTKLVKMRKTLQEGKSMEDPDNIARLMIQIREGADKDVIYKAFQDGVIKDPATLKDLLDRSDRYTKARQEGSGILTTADAKRYLGIIRQRTTPTEQFKGDPNNAQDVYSWVLRTAFLSQAGLSDEGLQATQEFENMLMDWDAKHPNAGLKERYDATKETGDLVLMHLPKPNGQDALKGFVEPPPQ